MNANSLFYSFKILYVVVHITFDLVVSSFMLLEIINK